MRRPLLTILIFLLAGAVVNVGVAWTITAVPKWRRRATSEIKVEWPRPVPDHWPERANHRILIRNFGWRYDQYQDIWNGVFVIHIVSAGWPCLALESEYWIDGPKRVRSPWGITLPLDIFGFGPRSFKKLPGRPIWPGFLFNTLFYAAILWLVIPGPFALRRLIRRRRGLCPACGYDLRHGEHEACPECGLAA